MKNAKNANPVREPKKIGYSKSSDFSNGANFWQIDHKIRNIYKTKGVTILSGSEAWQRFKWSREWFEKKPKEGYFIWIKKQIDFPLFSCISIAQKNIKQELQNLIILEKNLKISLQGTCNSLKKDLCGVHRAEGKIILKEGSSLKYNHIHSWGKTDIVDTDYEFFLERNSKLDYIYKNLFPPKKLRIKTVFNLLEGTTANIKIVADCQQTKTEIVDILNLKKKNASGQIQLRLVGGKNSKISAYSQILAEAKGRGHLDCQGLLVGKDSIISLEPKLICKNKLAQLTHEASIGKIEEEQLNYLRQRGLSEESAINLIVNGFLEITPTIDNH